MADTSPILDYTTTPRRRSLPWQAIAALPPLLFAPMTMCMCGHMDWFSLPLTLAAASLSWWAFARKDQPPGWRLIVVVLVVLASLELTKNVADILWFGHEPLLRRAG